MIFLKKKFFAFCYFCYREIPNHAHEELTKKKKKGQQKPFYLSLRKVVWSRDQKSSFPASPLKFRHMSKGCLYALLQARVGSLKLTPVEYSTPSHIAFIWGQWQLTAADLSTQLFTMWCQLSRNNFCRLSFAFPCFSLTPFPTFFFLSHLPYLAKSTSHLICSMLFALLCCTIFSFSALEQPASQQCQSYRLPAMTLF